MKTSNVASSRSFQLVAAHPALDFINTLDWRFRECGPEELLKTYSDLVHFTEQSNLLTPTQTQHLLRTVTNRKAAKVLGVSKELREALAETVYSRLDDRTPAANQLKILERQLQAARLHQKLHRKDSRVEWSLAGAEDAAELPLWLLSLSTSDLITSEATFMVRACDNPECRWLFLDTSKNHTKRWCDMKLCGNRMKARRFKAQRAS
ncbi:MAG TPA: CGNR zinc finger domain-containing protein [Edaphobacter sp.]